MHRSSIPILLHPNSSEALQEHIKAGQIGWIGPLVMTFLITIIAAITNIVLTALFAVTGNSTPGATTLAWINIWNTIIYLPVVLVLAYFVRKEGIRIADLIGFERAHVVRDILQGIGFGFLFFGVDALFEFVSSRAVFALFGDPFAGMSFAHVPAPSLLTVLFGLFALPFAAGIVEELVYRGYALPRLSALSKPLVGLVIMSLGFGLQHVGLALAGDWRVALYRGIALFFMGVVMGVIYFKQKRLLPLIVGHVFWDFLGIGLLAGLLPLLTSH